MLKLFSILPFLAATAAIGITGSDNVNVLHPINVLEFEAAIELQRRNNEPDTIYSSLTPSKEARLIFGSPGPKGEMLLADMMLKAPKGLPIVMMERLGPLTTGVDCSTEGDGALSVTWKDEQAYQEALKSWSWINENKNSNFLIITNHAGCGPDNQRQAYKITSVETDAAKKMTVLKAEVAPWSKVAGTYSMDFGKAYMSPGSETRLMTRGFPSFDDFKNGVADVSKELADTVKGEGEKAVDAVKKEGEKVVENAKGFKDKALEEWAKKHPEIGKIWEDLKAKGLNAINLKEAIKLAIDQSLKIDTVRESIDKETSGNYTKGGDAEIPKTVEWDISGGQQNGTMNIYNNTNQTDVNYNLNIDCKNCFIKGKFKITGHLSVREFKIQQLLLGLTPSGFHGAVNVNTTAGVSFNKTGVISSSSKGSQNNSTTQKYELSSTPLKARNHIIVIPVPAASIMVPNIFSLGLFGSVEAGFDVGFKGQMQFTTGFNISIPDSAHISLNMIDIENSKVDGFTIPNANPDFQLENAYATVNGSIWFRPKFELKATVNGIAEIAAAIKMSLPKINTNVTVEHKEKGGVCSIPKYKTGFKYSVSGDFDITAELEIQPMLGNLNRMTIASKNLFLIPLFRNIAGCIALDSSGSPEKPKMRMGVAPSMRGLKTRKPVVPAGVGPISVVPRSMRKRRVGSSFSKSV